MKRAQKELEMEVAKALDYNFKSRHGVRVKSGVFIKISPENFTTLKFHRRNTFKINPANWNESAVAMGGGVRKGQDLKLNLSTLNYSKQVRNKP